MKSSILDYTPHRGGSRMKYQSPLQFETDDGMFIPHYCCLSCFNDGFSGSLSDA
jgi:hypothetical protein